MTEHEDNRVHYLLEHCAVTGSVTVDRIDMGLILKHQRELGNHETLKDLAEHDKEVRNKTIEELRNIFCEDVFDRFSWCDGTMNFNNCSLMMREIIEKLKEGGENDHCRMPETQEGI